MKVTQEEQADSPLEDLDLTFKIEGSLSDILPMAVGARKLGFASALVNK